MSQLVMNTADSQQLLSGLQMLSDKFRQMEALKFNNSNDTAVMSVLDFVEETTIGLLFPPEQQPPPEHPLEFFSAVHRRIGEISRGEIFTALEKRPDILNINECSIEKLREAISLTKGRGGRDRIASRLADDVLRRSTEEDDLADKLFIAH